MDFLALLGIIGGFFSFAFKIGMPCSHSVERLPDPGLPWIPAVSN